MKRGLMCRTAAGIFPVFNRTKWILCLFNKCRKLPSLHRHQYMLCVAALGRLTSAELVHSSAPDSEEQRSCRQTSLKASVCSNGEHTIDWGGHWAEVAEVLQDSLSCITSTADFVFLKKSRRQAIQSVSLSGQGDGAVFNQTVVRRSCCGRYRDTSCDLDSSLATLLSHCADSFTLSDLSLAFREKTVASSVVPILPAIASHFEKKMTALST